MAGCCIECRQPLDDLNGRGRPAAYCGEPCRRAREFRIRRLNRHLERLEGEAIGISAGSFWPGATAGFKRERVAAIGAEIVNLETQLRELMKGR